MRSSLKYRIIGLTLVGIFAVFNIGVPIVVASCPMMKYADSKVCVMCNDGIAPGNVRFTNTIDKSCCATKYIAERNKTEFLQTNSHSLESQQTHLILDSFVAPHAVISSSRFVFHLQTSAPRSTDIPILISSLLI